MQIEIGKIYINKTYKYLLPYLSMHGPTFVAKLNSIFNLAFGIHDSLLDGTEFEDQQLVYILCDKAYQPAKFLNFLDYVKNQQYYVTDYAFDDMEKGRKHMVVIKFPENETNIYSNFCEGKYSKMYTDKEINTLFVKDSEAKQVLVKSSSMKNRFIKKVYDSFGTTLTDNDILEADTEYDFPPEKEKEYFNYKKP